MSYIYNMPALTQTAALSATILITTYDPWPDSFPTLSHAEKYVTTVCTWKKFDYCLPANTTAAQKKKVERQVAYRVAIDAYRNGDFRLDVGLVQKEVLNELVKLDAKRLLSHNPVWPSSFSSITHARSFMNNFSYNVSFQYSKIPGTPFWRTVGWVTYQAAVMAWKEGAFGLEKAPFDRERGVRMSLGEGDGEKKRASEWKKDGLNMFSKREGDDTKKDGVDEPEKGEIQHIEKDVKMNGDFCRAHGVGHWSPNTTTSNERIEMIKKSIGELTSGPDRPRGTVSPPSLIKTSIVPEVTAPKITPNPSMTTNEKKQAHERFVPLSTQAAENFIDRFLSMRNAASTAPSKSVSTTSTPPSGSVGTTSPELIPNLMFFSDSESDDEENGDAGAVSGENREVEELISL